MTVQTPGPASAPVPFNIVFPEGGNSMPDQDKTGVPGHEVPPPKPLPPLVVPAAVGSVALNLVALVVVYFGHCDLATILIALAALLGGHVVYYLLSSPSDKQPVDGHEPPPP
jgi:hypothetical protein